LAVFDSVLREELQRLKALRARYVSQLAEIPSGSIVIKLKGGHSYAYRAYRKGHKARRLRLEPSAQLRFCRSVGRS
jgi:hypothetical protein